MATTVDITTSGTWVVPAGVTSIDALCIGSGGAGAAGTVTGGGGGGSSARTPTLTVTPGETLTITVGPASAVGAAGSVTSIKRGTTVLVSANGGNAGAGNLGGAGGPVTGNVGTNSFAGASGAGYVSPTGGRGGAAANGTAAGTGQAGIAPGGSGGSGATGSTPPTAGGLYGGGGGGGNSTVGNTTTGTGAAGLVRIVYTAAATPPTITSTATASVAENATLSKALTASEAGTWAIRTVAQDATSLDAADFALSGATLQWLGNGTQNFEAPADSNLDNVYKVVVRFTSTATGLTADQLISVTVTDVAEAPTITSTATATVAENTALAKTLSATDPEGGVLTWSLRTVAQNAASVDVGDFSLSATTGNSVTLRWNANGTKDFEAPTDSNGDNVYVVVVRCADAGGLFTEQTVSVTVTNVAEAPTITSTATASVAENATLAKTLSATDPEGGTLTWSLRTTAQNAASTDPGQFSLSATTGNSVTLRWNANGTKDFEAPTDSNGDNVYTVVVRCADAGGLFDEQTVSVTVTNVVDETAPTITTSPSQSVDENAQLAIALTADETVTWSITGGADAAQFEISGTTLRWAGNGTKNFEAPTDSNGDNAYQVTVRATDTSGNVSSLVITVTVGDVFEVGPKFMIITGGSSFVVPADWNPANNKIHCIGAGGSTGNLTQGGAGGSYAAKNNVALTPGAAVACQVGTWTGQNGVNSTANTWVSSNTFLRASCGYGGGQGTTNIGDVTFNGGSTSTTTRGGGGAAGPDGAGLSPVGTTGGAGNNGSVAGGVGPTAGASGAIWTDNSGGPNNGLSAGPGGGGGGSATAGQTGGDGGRYGGGCGVAPVNSGSSQPGVIVLEWVPIPVLTGNVSVYWFS